ncbi:transcription factor TFIIIB subunit brf1 [Coemansia sp. RSA 355]|nr:transcription factor TFIIIB subunit brf1 [Coemansia sp. RSA 355]
MAMSKRKLDDTEHETCKECGSLDLIHDPGNTYCGDCGTVVDELNLTFDHTYDPERIGHSTYIRHQRLRNNQEKSSVERFGNSWSRERTAQGHTLISAITGQLQQPGICERAQRIFDDYIVGRMAEHCVRAFGSFVTERASACVYVAALEASRQVNLVDLARVARRSVFAIGREAKRVVRVLGLRTEPLDPVLRAETTVNRVFGYVHKAQADTVFKAQVMELIAGTTQNARCVPERLIEYLSDASTRPKLIALTARLVEFSRSCALSAGVSANTLTCAAIAIAIEHYMASCPDNTKVLRRSQRVCIYKLAALPNGTSQQSVARHVSQVHRALVEASKTVPWLSDIKKNVDAVVDHVEDVLFCYQQAQAWVFSTQTECDDAEQSATSQVTKVVSELSKAPAFVRAETTRQRRQLIIDKCTGTQTDGDRSQNADERETVVVRKLLEVGMDTHALLTLPTHTLEAILPAATRRHNSEYKGLDNSVVGPQDMSDEEIRMYLNPLPTD